MREFYPLSEISWDENLELLKNVPGIDPVMAYATGEPEQIPTQGWLVSSTLVPGKNGVVEVFRYGEWVNGPKIDHRPVSADVDMSATLKDYGSYFFSYQKPSRNMQPHYTNSPASALRLPLEYAAAENFSLSEDEGIFWAQHDKLLDNTAGCIDIVLTSHDIDVKSEEETYQRSAEINVIRSTSDPSELRNILSHLGFAMGMPSSGISTVQHITDTKILPAG